MHSTKKHLNFIYLLLFLSTMACNRETVVDLDELPFDSNLAVECYLERGDSARLLLVETQPYLTEIDDPTVNGAIVILEYIGPNGVGDFTDTLENLDVLNSSGVKLFAHLDTTTGKFFNYSSERVISPEEGGEYFLRISDLRGRAISGSTRFLPPPEIDRVEFRLVPEEDSIYTPIVYVNDPGDQRNFYRLLVNFDSTNNNKAEDILADDEFINGNVFPIITNMRVTPKDSIFFRLFNLQEDYYNYLDSKNRAIFSNGNPFTQPEVLESTVKGGEGVFTTIQYDTAFRVVP